MYQHYKRYEKTEQNLTYFEFEHSTPWRFWPPRICHVKNEKSEQIRPNFIPCFRILSHHQKYVQWTHSYDSGKHPELHLLELLTSWYNLNHELKMIIFIESTSYKDLERKSEKFPNLRRQIWNFLRTEVHWTFHWIKVLQRSWWWERHEGRIQDGSSSFY